ncbi:MAG TPA: DUF6088 family protein [Candidatus Obscuribacterales bacterium]
MYVASLIRAHIFGLPPDMIFSTRDLLHFGRRSAVDQTLYRLVKSGFIVRVARGLFIRDGSAILSTAEVAAAKAKAFGRKIISHGLDAAHAMGLVANGNSHPVFSTDGHSTSFQFGCVRIELKQICPRKMLLGESTVGLLIRGMWILGPSGIDAKMLRRTMARLRRSDHDQLMASARYMPAWIWQLFMFRR